MWGPINYDDNIDDDDDDDDDENYNDDDNDDVFSKTFFGRMIILKAPLE